MRQYLARQMSAVYKNRGGERSQNTLIRRYFARQCQLYTRTGEESEHTDAAVSGKTISAVSSKTISAVYKNRRGGRSQNTVMRRYLARKCQFEDSLPENNR